MADETAVPTPLGWCSWCLGDHQEEHQAVTLFDGTALCRSCNEAANQNANQHTQDVEDALSSIQGRSRGLLGG